MQITSHALAPEAPIALPYAELAAGGQNLRPDLAWTDVPEGTKSFAVTCFDPDAPTGSGWWHWVGFDIPADVTTLEAGCQVPQEAENDYGYVGWGGPCPPAGTTHRYVFTVYALDVETLGAGDKATSAAIRFMIMEHALASASLTREFAVPASPGLQE